MPSGMTPQRTFRWVMIRATFVSIRSSKLVTQLTLPDVHLRAI